jgi:hypothetical protein
MPWFKLDDSFHSHPKVIKAGNEATGLYVRCGSYAAQHLTDGFIPEQVALHYGTPKLADALVSAKLWRRVRGGWRMPDYLQYNPSKEAVENERKQAAERQKRRRGRMVSQRDTPRDSGRSSPSPGARDTEGVTSAPAAANGRAGPSGSAARGRKQKPKPPWCGMCDRETRLTGPADAPHRCMNCHPLIERY